MLNINEVAEELQELTAWQETPNELTETDYIKMVVQAIRRFFVDINHPSEYDRTLYITDENGKMFYNRDFIADEEEYILCLCKIGFFQRVQTDVNNTFGYTTNALTVTNADKPYANLQQTLNDLRHDRQILFNKMTRYVFGDS